MRLCILLFYLFHSTTSFGLETDNYLVWGKELKDSGYRINAYLEDEVKKSLEEIDDHSKSCQEVTIRVARRFASKLVHDNPVENWLFENLSRDEIYPQNIWYVRESIYQEPYRFYIPWFGLAPNIQVNGHYFGTDKLSHFASTGMSYFKIYRKHSDERKAIDWGINDEKTLHGYWASGVFSYADLEANYQGLKFYRNFCEGESPYLKLQNKKWKLTRSPRIEDYVSSYWDETVEESYHLPKNWERISRILESSYCSNIPEKKKGKPSYSKTYLEELKLAGKIPTPQGIRSICPKAL